MTEAERTPWFRCGWEDPARPGLYEVLFSVLGTTEPYEKDIAMARWTGRCWRAAGSITPAQGWGDCWRGLLRKGDSA